MDESILFSVVKVIRLRVPLNESVIFKHKVYKTFCIRLLYIYACVERKNPAGE